VSKHPTWRRKFQHGTKKLGVTNSKCGVANQKWADVRSTKSGDNGGQHDKRPEVDNQNDIETQSDRDASLRRALLGLQLENERLKALVVTLTNTVPDNVLSNIANKNKRD
jgi:hypothetical protein